MWSVLTYGCESWTLGKQERDRLQAMEMWIWRRIMGTGWMARKRTLLKKIEERKAKSIGHTIQHNNFLGNIFEGKILGKKPRGRPRASIFQSVIDEMGCGSYDEDGDGQGIAFRR